ncbi:hypothetical protein [Streptomyces sp. H27-D2]|uniref:hypothetical protein n=1 Tax=Streptomyces sp. H27-D2 TaxID=3046304 RepID=UPI002DC03C65|nr:hypothetical protein [Streptomyces sp. H27-D2]MEC4016121.1 hypothetical protein [Streptomyces sp. H27-D2]
MTELMGINIVQGGSAALLALAVVWVLSGRLLPRRTYDDLRAERDTWRDAHTASEAARRLEREQVSELLELSKTAGHVLTSLPRPGPTREEVTPDADLDQAPAP